MNRCPKYLFVLYVLKCTVSALHIGDLRLIVGSSSPPSPKKQQQSFYCKDSDCLEDKQTETVGENEI